MECLCPLATRQAIAPTQAPGSAPCPPGGSAPGPPQEPSFRRGGLGATVRGTPSGGPRPRPFRPALRASGPRTRPLASPRQGFSLHGGPLDGRAQTGLSLERRCGLALWDRGLKPLPRWKGGAGSCHGASSSNLCLIGATERTRAMERPAQARASLGSQCELALSDRGPKPLPRWKGGAGSCHGASSSSRCLVGTTVRARAMQRPAQAGASLERRCGLVPCSVQLKPVPRWNDGADSRDGRPGSSRSLVGAIVRTPGMGGWVTRPGRPGKGPRAWPRPW